MAEPFKNLFTIKKVQGMASHFQKHWPAFNAKEFEAAATENFECLELKARSNQIKDAMVAYLPTSFKQAGEIILASLGAELEDDLSAGFVDDQGIAGWSIMPMADYVGQQGQEYFDLSMTLFKEMTKRSTSEFGIRYFLSAMPERTLSVLKTWAKDDNQHVRRLVSEGSRPRLPWGMRLSVFIDNPHPVVELLEILKDDEKEYVRRSVANNLNDIAKDHPDLVANIATQWLLGASKERKRLVNHACRSLVKKGHGKTLGLLGFDKAKITNIDLVVVTSVVKFGDALVFSLSIDSAVNYDQPLMIDYIIHHQKANGTTSPKVFKWRTLTVKAKESISLVKNHAIKQITTRVYYAGLHRLEIIINGESVAAAEFQLLMHGLNGR